MDETKRMVSEQLDTLIAKRGELDLAEINASRCQTRLDYDKRNAAEEAYYECYDQTVQALTHMIEGNGPTLARRRRPG